MRVEAMRAAVSAIPRGHRQARPRPAPWTRAPATGAPSRPENRREAGLERSRTERHRQRHQLDHHQPRQAQQRDQRWIVGTAGSRREVDHQRQDDCGGDGSGRRIDPGEGDRVAEQQHAHQDAVERATITTSRR